MVSASDSRLESLELEVTGRLNRVERALVSDEVAVLGREGRSSSSTHGG